MVVKSNPELSNVAIKKYIIICVNIGININVNKYASIYLDI